MANIHKMIKEKKREYKKIKKVYCPILDCEVTFAADGFFHLIRKANGKPRKISSQYLRLKTLKFATRVVKNCKEVNKIEERKVKIKGKQKKATYYILIHEVYYGKRVKVVLTKIGKGKVRFRSIMPQGKWYKKKRHK